MRVRIDRVSHSTRLRVPTVAVAIGSLALGLFGCSSDKDNTGSAGAGGEVTSPASDSTEADGASGVAETAAPEQAGGAGTSGEFVLLDVDPCSLLTAAEMESALGAPVEQGGFGEDLPGRCTHSVGGDVGAGVVGISVGDPLYCAGIERAIEAINSGATASGAVVDVGEGGVVEADGGTIQFLVGGGCVGISASNSGIGLDQATMIGLATVVVGRVG